MKLLVINCGSSSLKFSLIDLASGLAELAGIAEQLDAPGAALRFRRNGGGWVDCPIRSGAGHAEAMRAVTETALPRLEEAGFDGVVHRVVHGGELFKGATRIDRRIVAEIEALSKLAPLHNPVNVVGIRAALAAFPGLPQVAVFDTAYHQSMPPEAFLYALPYSCYEDTGARRYGFHGASHRYCALEAAARLGKPPGEVGVISAHLGNGCSATASYGARSLDTTMGLTPAEGLVMGTRSGDVDPGIARFLHVEKGLGFDEIDQLLNKQSGLLGLSGISNDMRTLREAAASGEARAGLAIDVFVYRLAKAIAGLRAALPRCDALVFTGGIGENDAATRLEACARIGFLGIELDELANRSAGAESGGLISGASSAMKVFVVNANEELMMAREAAAFFEAVGTF